jgi:ABC-type sugar transport system ATPase subunit
VAPVEFDRVTKRFDAVEAVRELTLAARDGEFLVLVGPSGSGKTTALRMLAGLESVTEGEIRIGGSTASPRASATSPWCSRTTRSTPR